MVLVQLPALVVCLCWVLVLLLHCLSPLLLLLFHCCLFVLLPWALLAFALFGWWCRGEGQWSGEWAGQT